MIGKRENLILKKHILNIKLLLTELFCSTLKKQFTVDRVCFTQNFTSQTDSLIIKLWTQSTRKCKSTEKKHEAVFNKPIKKKKKSVYLLEQWQIAHMLMCAVIRGFYKTL